jgi:hypothetical protein
MSGKFIGSIVAAAIALTAFGANAVQADDRNTDLERAIAAILGVAIVGKIIHEKNKRDDRGKQHAQPHQGHGTHAGVQPMPLPDRINKRLLPRQCFRSFHTRRGIYRGFGERCLSNNFRYVNQMPRYCMDRIRTDRGPRRVYDARCLRDAGYRLARR